MSTTNQVPVTPVSAQPQVAPEVKPKRKYTKRKKTKKAAPRNTKPSTRTRIITMLQTGLTTKQVQALLGVSMQTVYDVKYRYNQENKDNPIILRRSKKYSKPILDTTAAPPSPTPKGSTPPPVPLTWRQRITALFTGRV